MSTHSLGETGGTESGALDRLIDELKNFTTEHLTTLGDHVYDHHDITQKAAEVLTSLRAERDEALGLHAEMFGERNGWQARATIAESSLAAEKLKVAELERSILTFRGEVTAEMVDRACRANIHPDTEPSDVERRKMRRSLEAANICESCASVADHLQDKLSAAEQRVAALVGALTGARDDAKAGAAYWNNPSTAAAFMSVAKICNAALATEARAMSTQMSNDVGELVERLVVAEVAGCTCHIKTPEIAYHASNCHYRLFREAWTEIERLNKWADGFSDAQLKERRLAEERIAELATALSSQAAEIAELRKALEKIAAPYAGEDDTLLIPLALIGAELRKRQSIARAALTRKEG